MMHLLRLPGLGTMHASAVEVYANHAYDLLADRKPLQVSKHDLKVAPKVGQAKLIAKNSGSTGYPGRNKYKEEQRKRAEFKAKLEAQQREQAEQKMRPRQSRGSTRTSKSGSSEEFTTMGETLLRLSTPADVARLARQVEASRVAQGHALNECSSRSHCLVHLHLVTKDAGTGMLHKRKMLFVDLAGSERIVKSKVEGMRRGEAVGINQSLSCLGRVIKALGEGSDGHVPFRDSMLTMLLRSSFGGRSLTSVVVNVAADKEHLEESVCSLRFGQRMCHVHNTATVVVGQDVTNLAQDVQERLQAAKAALEVLEDRGLGPRFAPDANSSEVRSFQRNLAFHQSLQGQLSAARQALVEARGAGGSGMTLQKQVGELEFQVENIKMIILRQKSIKGFYKKPTSSFTAKQAEINALQAQKQLVDAQT